MRVAIVFGTRPEAIKLAPVIRELEARDIETVVVATGQHREMLDQMLARFGIVPDVDLDVMQPGQDLNRLSSRLLAGVGATLEQYMPDWVLVQGDTTSAFCGAIAAFHLHIPVGHVEAGLRTGDLSSPFPEEANRTLIGTLATTHFCPTSLSQENLLREGKPVEQTPVVGNTVIDSLLWAVESVREDQPIFPAARPRRALVTLHRRENQGEPMTKLAHSLRRLSDQHQLEIVFPLHKSPAVRQAIEPILAGHDDIHLVEPLDYFSLVKAMSECTLVLTDSGGIQEEAPTLAKPVLVLRNTTERPEGVAAGVARLVGTDPDRVYHETERLLLDQAHYQSMATGHNPYGDGKAARRIADHLTGTDTDPLDNTLRENLQLVAA